MIFYFYLTVMGLAVLLSLFNLRAGDIRLVGLALGYFVIVAGFHLVFMTWLELGWLDPEFYLLVAGAQFGIAYMAYRIGCMAARIVMPVAWIAVILNVFTFLVGAEYPHQLYFDWMNLIQCAQIASIIFASSLFKPITDRMGWTARKKHNGMERVAHGQRG